MSDDALSGTAGSVTIGGTVVGELNEWSLDIEHAPVEMTAFGDVWQQYIPSLLGATGSFSGNFDEASAPQAALLAALQNGSVVGIGLWLDATTRMEGQVLVTGIGDGVTVAGADTALFDFQATDGFSYELPRRWLLEDGTLTLWEDGTTGYLTL